jgi:hypothetical protein
MLWLQLAHGASLHRQGDDGTALQYAKDTGNSKMVDMLYNRGKAARLASLQVSGPPNTIKKFLQFLGIAAPTPTCTKCNSMDVELTAHLRRHAEWKCHACGKLWYVKK